MADIAYRAARPDDVGRMADLFLTALSDMYGRNNISAPAPPRGAVLLGYEHVRSTGVFRLAESDGRIIAIAGAIIRDKLWYLSAFWVYPDMQQKKIGMPLLRQVFEAGKEAGAAAFFTWSSVDMTAMASYMKVGMLPGYEILAFEGAPDRLHDAPYGCESAPLEMSVAMELDLTVRGTRREVDHELWSGRAGLMGRQVLCNGKAAGYYYINRGVIGPAAWKEPRYAGAVLALACRDAAAMERKIGFAVPGINKTAIRFALDSGLRLVNNFHFLTSARFGRMEQYLPSGPSLY
ncbi:MAG: GNAT family N-acetyltransferase [Deltaproteobacteria bacterium]|nr:GNAT family N-acetyltransferase [Deltaproteobacteria bacterium]